MSSGMGIGDFAARIGVKASAVRYYEAEGLLPKPSRRSGKRVYESDDLVRLRLIVSARQLGFSISDLRGLAGLAAPELKLEAKRRATNLRSSIADLVRVADSIEQLSKCPCDQGLDCAWYNSP